jgi:inosine-uridine nucleoside N-ribohydrolase
MEEEVIPLGTPFSKFVTKATGYDSGTKKFRNKEVLYLHDPLAVGVVAHPDLVKKERLAIRVEAEEGDRYGQISEVKNGPMIDVCLKVDAKKFLGLFTSRLT